MRVWVIVTGVVLGVAAVLVGLDRLGLWMERRGWLYYRRSRRRSATTVGNALLELQTLVDPGKRTVLEERRRERREETAASDPPDAGSAGGRR